MSSSNQPKERKKTMGKYQTKVGIEVAEKVISLKEVNQEFLTGKSLQAYLGGVSKDFVKDLRESGQLSYYRLRNTILYKVADVRRLVEKGKVV